ncbi:TetR/AcrR family transcriptional regulator [Streptomyces xinghaiensis]|uniref:TetR/AcrR family transcriptional regulator n=1 Tax=Streptomyces xinghaiensis TaxID=1038928 RepID=A0A3R7IND7_9ACTN|nr:MULTISPECIES: TetR/AcrR family transcriptional regulator [Streptomyces]OFA44226.1 hypothetical protein BEN35_22760 [Streptomyces fradiae]PQM20582.1 TetR/AcrR family transcriptional regulator [Streptomyces xinghaiensis]RKM92524.1 TetR/AcrR family transcriptional regulator [Streptomyces xinghaiensis]RNC70491.1 TetR/AcrR family transcriptional regulator [Streptomyces xinghaiensis]
MTTARERLMDTAIAALSTQPWTQVRMQTIAVASRVSRQTLYNEFGSKDGLARALAWREIDRYLAGVERALTGPPRARPVDRLAALADWTWRTAHNPLARAVLTDCWDERLPRLPRATAEKRRGPYVAERHRVAGPLPSPADLVAEAQDLAVAALVPGRPPEEARHTAVACEIVLRLALSSVIAPLGKQKTGWLIRRALRPDDLAEGAARGRGVLPGPSVRRAGTQQRTKLERPDGRQPQVTTPL